MSDQNLTIIKFDRLTKAVLTIIAILLAYIAADPVVGTAHAQSDSGCGTTYNNPCYVKIVQF
jgi:hypothetical protein